MPKIGATVVPHQVGVVEEEEAEGEEVCVLPNVLIVDWLIGRGGGGGNLYAAKKGSIQEFKGQKISFDDY